MDEVVKFFIAAFVSLFTIINPFSTASVFHAISKGNTKRENRVIAKRASVIAVFVLIFFIFLGNYVLNFFNVSIDAFKIASGVLVFGVGYRMINSHRKYFSEEEEKHVKDKDDISIIPLAIPMLSGPGAIATALVLMENASGDFLSIASIVVSVIIVCAIAYFLLIKSHSLDKYLGKTGIKVIDKILGLFVLVIGVQFIVSGLAGIVPGWF